MLARACSAAVNGIEAYAVEVEVNSGWGETIIVIVGLPDAAVRESRDRVTTALHNSGYKIPMGRTTINLAPADVKKEGPSFDLPIAIATLAANEQIETDQLDHFAMVGELALTGAVVGVLGVAGSLPLLRSLLSAHASDMRLGTIAIVVLALALLAATCLPAKRASKLDPAEALRSD